MTTYRFSVSGTPIFVFNVNHESQLVTVVDTYGDKQIRDTLIPEHHHTYIGLTFIINYYLGNEPKNHQSLYELEKRIIENGFKADMQHNLELTIER